MNDKNFENIQIVIEIAYAYLFVTLRIDALRLYHLST